MLVYFNGLVLGLSLIMALGPQNVFLIRQGALRRHAFLSVLICFSCDVILMCASVAGLNKALSIHPVLQVWLTWFGVLFLLYYGSTAFKKGLVKNDNSTSVKKAPYTRLQIILLALGFSLLNPHAIIDSLIIIGGGSSQFPEHQYAFLLGVITASFLWFSSLTFTSHYFANIISRASIWRGIELSSGLLMLFLSFKLASSVLL